MLKLEQEPIAANESEKLALNKIEGVLAKARPKLVGPDGEIELPESVFQVLKQIVHHMMLGRAIFIIPENKELTTQEAADLLHVSRPYLVRLLDQGEIPCIKVGTHRRIRFSDLMTYKKLRDTKRARSLEEIAQISQEAGLYN